MTLGERIQEYRKAAGLSQEALAEKIGVSRQSVSKWENDAALPDTENILALRRLFGVSADALLSGEAQPPAPENPPKTAETEEPAAGAAETVTEIPAAEKAESPRRWLRRAAVIGLLCVIAGLAAVALWLHGDFPPKKTQAEPYPYVLVHGLGGWGAGSGMDSLAKYWGGDTGDLAAWLREQGYKVYTPSIGPISSTWDRACELYAILCGGTVDYGAAHAAQHSHARYGRTYATPLLPAWDAQHKLNLAGHSFGGETVRLLASLMTYGDAAEQAAGAEISPLFTGGKGDYIHSVTTLCSPHNGSSLTNVLDSAGALVGIRDTTELLASLCFTAAGIADPLNGVYDFMLDQFGLTDLSGGIPEIAAALKPILSNGIDHAGYDLSPDGAAALNQTIRLDPFAYYFSYAYCTTQNSNLLYTQRPASDTLPVLLPFAIAMGSYQGKTPGGILIDSAWLPNDGLVNVISAKYPFGDPHTVLGEDAPEKGVWSVAPLRHGHHGTVIGLGADAKTTQAFYTELFAMIDALE